MTLTNMHRGRSAAKGVVARQHYSGIPVVERPPGFGTVVADDGRFFADRTYLHRIRPLAPVELDVEQAIGVRRAPTASDHALFTLVRRGNRHVTERSIVALPTHMSWASCRETLARALWEQATSLAYLGVEDEEALMSIGPEADAFSVAFDVEKPFAVTWRGTAHIYYRTAENAPTEHWICAALVRENLYSSLPTLSERYVKRMRAEDDAMARALEVSQ